MPYGCASASLLASVSCHHLGEELLHRRRRVGDCIGAGFDRGKDGIGLVAARRDNGDIGVLLPDSTHDIDGILAACDIQDGSASCQAGIDIGLGCRDRHDGRDIDSAGDAEQVNIRDRCIEDDAHGTLGLHVLRKRYCSHATCRAAADAAEYRHARSADDGSGDGLLGREGIDRKHGIRIAVLDDGKVGREDEALDPSAVDDDAGGTSYLLWHLQDVVAEPRLDGGDGTLFLGDLRVARKRGSAFHDGGIAGIDGLCFGHGAPRSVFGIFAAFMLPTCAGFTLFAEQISVAATDGFECYGCSSNRP